MAFTPPNTVIAYSPRVPGGTPLSIGGVPFNSEECPSHLPIGEGRQVQTVVELIGGGRVVHNFGAQPQPITWSGEFWDHNIQPRVSLLRAYMVSGQEVLVTWANESYHGIVKSFKPTYQNSNRCGYDITVEVTRDANGAFSKVSAASIDSQVSALLAAANKADDQIMQNDASAAAAGLQASLSQVVSGIQDAGPLAQVTGPDLTSLQNTIGTALSAVTSYVGGLPQGHPNFVPGTQLVAVLGLMQKNLTQGQSPRVIQVQGGSLVDICAQYYGDATLAGQLAAANGLSTFRIPNGKVLTLTLPPFQAAQ